MKENYMEQTAEDLFNMYSTSPMSFIIRNFKAIAKECYFGAEFIQSFIKTTIIPCNLYDDLKRQIEDLIRDATENKVGDYQLNEYHRIGYAIDHKMDATKGTTKLFKIGIEKDS